MVASDTLRFALDDRINTAPVGPSHIPLALLGEFQREIETFLKGSDQAVDPGQVMVSIENGSLAILVSGLLAAASLWIDVWHLKNPHALGSLDQKRAAVVERWQAAARKHTSRSYSLAAVGGNLMVRVDSATDYRNQIEAAWVPVEKFLHGTIVDMGGATRPNIHLKLDDGRPLTIAATQQLIAGEEKNRLYRPALLLVSAEENLSTGALRNLTLLAFDSSQPRWDKAEFDRLVQKGTQVWAQVPDPWLEELRGRQG